MPEIVKELTIAPSLSATTDDPHAAEKADKGPPPSLSEKSETTGEVVPPAVDAKGTEVTPPPGDDVTATETADATGTEKPGAKEDQTPSWVKAWISKSKNEVAEAKREAAEANKRLTEVLTTFQKTLPEAKPVPTRQEPQPPHENQFDDPQAYRSALLKYTDERADWVAEQRVEKAVSEFRQVEAAKQQEAVAAKAESERQAFLEKGRSKHDDFAEICETESLSVTPIMFEAAKASDVGEDIVYFLGKNPAEAKRISALSPVLQVREISRLEAKLTAPPPARTPTKAPAPIRPVGSNNVVEKSRDEMSVDEYIATRRKEMGKVA